MTQGKCKNCGKRFTWPGHARRRRTFCPICRKALEQTSHLSQLTVIRLDRIPTGPNWFGMHDDLEGCLGAGFVQGQPERTVAP